METMKYKVLIISFLISLPFWWSLDFLGNTLAKGPEIFTADFSQKIRLKREQKQLLNNLSLENESVIVAEVNDSGNLSILFEKNSEKIQPIASISKLMTALIVFDLKETYSPYQRIKISKEAVSQEGASRFGDLRPGDNLFARSLVYKMLIESDNDSAFALSEFLGEDPFVDLMNIYSDNIGLKNTFFSNPTGLEKNTSTAKDLVQLAKYVMENYPQIFEITTYQPDRNTNKLLREIPGIIGGKTGWTPEAKGCLLLVLDNPENKSYFINVVLGSEDRFSDMKKIIKAVRRRD